MTGSVQNQAPYAVSLFDQLSEDKALNLMDRVLAAYSVRAPSIPMKKTIEATDLRDAIAKGVKSMVPLAIQLTSERGEAPRPEYLTTAAVSLELGAFAERFDSLELKIRCEEQTKVIWGKLRAHGLLGQRTATGRKSWLSKLVSMLRDASRKGNVDITLFRDGSFEKPILVVENKGLLHFMDNGELRAGSRSELKKDLDRNAEFVTEQGPAGGIEYSAFTFYLKDADSVTRADADNFLAAKRTYFEDYVRSIALPSHLRINVVVRSFDDNLYESKEAALEPGESGAPASDLDPAWHLAYGIISIYREGATIGDTRGLSAS